MHLHDEPDDDTSDSDNEMPSSRIIDSVLKAYSGEVSCLSRTKEILEAALRCGESCCLVCLESLKKNDAIWSCNCCFESLHLTCIQRWARDSIHQQRDQAIDRFGESAKVDIKTFNWSCPKCRTDYAYASIPSRYYCFCTKVADPPFDPWLVPHSCSKICDRNLQPLCGHKCLLPCHPGPCPPCPKTVQVRCYCLKAGPKVLRCSSKTWSCAQACGRILNCGQHRCEYPCHSGDCSPCKNRSVQKCDCRKKAVERPCYEPTWKCDSPCGKPYGCGSHKCDVICHDGPCGPCPLSLVRTCPCGKSSHKLPCTTTTPTCGDTCGKKLACGVHACAERCHRSACGTCLQMSIKHCRCGSRQKELPCYKDFTCETKCKRFKDCRRHPCNKKCCTGDCAPCEQICGRVLRCGNHKCVSRCHQGQCYPCHEKVQLKCACGDSVISVPCGREKVTKPPRCGKQCRIPTDCHHPERRKHLCHFGKCKPCQQQCGLKLPNCNHICLVACHDNVLVKIDQNGGKQRAGPWEKPKEPVVETKRLACPPCQVPIPVTCLGGHETREWPCHRSTPSSCQRPCDRLLTCTNHTCSMTCHRVEIPASEEKAGLNCQVCEEPCLKARPENCTHLCPRPCHAGDCLLCSQTVKVRCHCGINWAYYRCGEWASGNETMKEDMKCCKDQCPKVMSCGHRCLKLCHSGPCAEPRECNKRTKVWCQCKRLKKDLACNQIQGNGKLDCDAACYEKMSASEKERLELELRRQKKIEELEQQELEKFSRKMNHTKKKRRDKPPIKEDELEGVRFWDRCTKLGIISAAVGAASIAVSYVLLFQLSAWGEKGRD